MSKEFENVAFELEVGARSDVVETDQGVHLIQRTSTEYNPYTNLASAMPIPFNVKEPAIFFREVLKDLNIKEAWKKYAKDGYKEGECDLF